MEQSQETIVITYKRPLTTEKNISQYDQSPIRATNYTLSVTTHENRNRL
jgi:hypothetical protein